MRYLGNPGPRPLLGFDFIWGPLRNVLAAVGVCAGRGSVANLKEAIVSTEREPGSASSRFQGGPGAPFGPHTTQFQPWTGPRRAAGLREADRKRRKCHLGRAHSLLLLQSKAPAGAGWLGGKLGPRTPRPLSSPLHRLRGPPPLAPAPGEPAPSRADSRGN